MEAVNAACENCNCHFYVQSFTERAKYPIRHCPMCGSEKIKRIDEKSPEERRKAVEDAAKRGFYSE